MVTTNQPLKDVVLGLLVEARSAGIDGITRTSLVKYVYLLDVFVAEGSAGSKTWTGVQWTFHHFGPYADALTQCLDWMEQMSFLNKDERSTADGRDFVLYRAPQRADVRPLDALGIPAAAITRVNQALRDFAFSLPKLLDFVYFQTKPMEDAHPGEVLRFDGCKRVDYKKDIRPLSLRVPDSKQVARMKELIDTVRAENQVSTKMLLQAVYDEHYGAALRVGDADNEEVESGSLVATLEFQRRQAE